MNESFESPAEAEPAIRPSAESDDKRLNMHVISAKDLGLQYGAWEMLQNRELLEIYAAHYNWKVVDHNGLLLTAKHLPGLGIIRAQVFSPEACRPDWPEQLGKLAAGNVLAQSNEKLDLPTRSRIDTYSFVMDLRPDTDALLQKFQRRARKAIRKGNTAGFVTQEAQGPKDIERYHELTMRVTHNGTLYHVPPASLLKALHRAGYGRLYLGYLDNRLVGGIYVLHDRYGHGLVSAYDTAAAGNVPGTTLFWHAFLKEKEMGNPFLDLGAQSLDEHPQLTLFKRSFSPNLVPAFRYELSPSRWRALASSAWRLQRRLRGKP